MAILQDEYQLSVAQPLAQLARVEAAIAQLATRHNINLNVVGVNGISNNLRQVNAGINRLSRANLNGTAAGATRLNTSFTQLSGSMATSLGVAQQLSGAFGVIPGIVGNMTSGFSTATAALSGLTTAQRMNTLANFALAGSLAAIGVAAAGLASHGVQQLKKFQEAYNIIRLQGDQSIGQFDDKIRALQESGGVAGQQFNRAELAYSGADLTKQGLEEAAAFKILATSMKLAAAEGEDLTNISSLLLANLRQFGLDGDAAAKEAEHFGDALTKASTAAASTAKEMQEGLAVIAPIAHGMGLTLEETLGLLTAVDNAGLKASTVGANSVRAVMMAITSPTGPAKAELNELGVALRNADGSARQGKEVLFDLIRAAQSSKESYDEATKAAVVHADTVEAAATIFRSRGVVGFLNMVGGAEKWIDVINKSEMKVKAYAEVMLEGLDKAQKRLKTSIDDLARSFALLFADKLTNGLDIMTAKLRALDGILNHPDTAKAYFDVLIVGLTGVATAAALLNPTIAGLLTASSLGGFLGVLRSTVAGGLFIKLATDIKNFATAAAVSFQVFGRAHGFATLLGLLGAFPAAMGAVTVAIVAASTAAVAILFKTAADVRHAYDQIDDEATKGTKNLLEKVKELQGQGEAGRIEAKLRLKIDQRYSGDVDKPNPANAAVLDKEILQLKEKLRAQRATDAQQLASGVAKAQDRKATEDQTKAYERLVDTLDELKDRFTVNGLTDFQRSLKSARAEVEALKKSIDEAESKGEITPTQAEAARIKVKKSEPSIIKGAVDKQLKSDADDRLRHERSVQDALLSVTKDGVAKRRAELNRQVADTKKAYDEEIKTALTNAKNAPNAESRRKFYAQASQLQRLQASEEKALRQQAAQDIEAINRERLTKAKQAHRQLLEMQATESSAAVKSLEQARDEAMARAGEGAQARLKVEQQYAPLLLRVERQRLEANAQAQRIAAQESLQSALEEAKTAGGLRGELERSARAAYLSQMRTLEQNLETDRRAVILSSERRIADARNAIYKEGLDKRLAHLNEATGKEIAQLQRTLQAERSAAVSRGDGGRVGIIDGALERLGEQAAENAKAFARGLESAQKQAGSLREELSGISATPLQKALSGAASPFDSVIKSTRDKLAEVQSDYAKVANPTSEQAAAFARNQSVLTGILKQATEERGQAIKRARIKYEQEANDAQQDVFSRLAKQEYDLGKITEAEYTRRLKLDLDYWTRRLNNAKRRDDSEGIDKATGKAEQIEAELNRLTQERRATLEQIASFEREELVAKTQHATSDRERLALIAQLNALDERRIATIDSEIKRLEGLGGQERAIVDLKRERLGLQQELSSRAQEEVEHAEALRKSVLERIDAENKLAADQAATQQEVMNARQRAMQNLMRRIRDVDTSIGNARSEEQVNKLITERIGLVGQVHSLQQDINKAPLEEEKTRFEISKAQNQLILERLGLSNNEYATSQLAVAEAQKALSFAQEAFDLAQSGGNYAEKQEAEKGLAQAQLAYAKSQREALKVEERLAEAAKERGKAEVEAIKRAAEERFKAAQQALEIEEAQEKVRLKMKGLVDDAVEVAKSELQMTEKRLELLRNAPEVNEAEEAKGVLAAMEAREKYGEALKEKERLLNELSGAEKTLKEELSGEKYRNNPIKNALKEIARAQESVTKAQREWASAKDGTAEKKKATDELTNAIKSQRSAIKSLAEVYQSQISSMEGVGEVAARLNKAAYGDKEKYDSNKESARLRAMEERRRVLQESLKTSLTNGNADEISKAADQLAKVEERITEQRKKMKGAGAYLGTDSGKVLSQQLADKVDMLGIEFDKEALNVRTRMEIAEKEAKAIVQLDEAVTRFEKAAGALKEEAAAQSTVVVSKRVRYVDSRGHEVDIAGRNINESRVAVNSTPLPQELLGAMKAMQSVSNVVPPPESMTVKQGQAPISHVVEHSPTFNSQFTITQVKGENGEDLARRVLQEIQDMARRSGKNCASLGRI